MVKNDLFDCQEFLLKVKAGLDQSLQLSFIAFEKVKILGVFGVVDQRVYSSSGVGIDTKAMN